MPIGAFKYVREVSSEDAVHLAANLLKENVAKKWKTQSNGEKSAHVILEFEEPQQITAIDIGNEHSAFVGVLVSKTSCQPDDFKEILLSSSFMTPIESRNSTNIHRVRCFSGDALTPTLLPDKWKLVKIVCTQPFNKHVQYGLSFIKVYIAASASASTTATSTSTAKPQAPLVPDKFKLTSNMVSSLGQFKLREESPDSEPDGKASLSLFQRWKASRDGSSSDKPAAPTAAAAIRDASSPAALRRLSGTKPAALKLQVSPAPTQASSRMATTAAKTETEVETKPLDRNRDELLFGDDDPGDDVQRSTQDAKKHRLSKHLEVDKNRRRLELEKEHEKQKSKTKRHSIDTSTTSTAKESPKESPQPSTSRPQKRLSSSVDVDVHSPAKKPKPNVEKAIKYMPFNQLLRGVVLVISGIQNPDRADLRSKAIALGAKYKADWESGCTHLICAFRNTPKYNQVKGKGKIVTRSWIEKCYTLKKYLPWRRYALDTNEVGQPESDEEVLDESLKPPLPANHADDDDDDVELVVSAKDREITHVSSDPDTEDELERVAQKNQLKKANDENRNHVNDAKPKKEDKSAGDDIYEVSTDEEDYLQEINKRTND